MRLVLVASKDFARESASSLFSIRPSEISSSKLTTQEMTSAGEVKDVLNYHHLYLRSPAKANFV